MQVTKTKERIAVIMVLGKDKSQPFSFQWGTKRYVVEKVNLVFQKQSANGLMISYSVTAQDAYFKLTFETTEMKWWLEEVVN